MQNIQITLLSYLREKLRILTKTILCYNEIILKDLEPIFLKKSSEHQQTKEPEIICQATQTALAERKFYYLSSYRC